MDLKKNFFLNSCCYFFKCIKGSNGQVFLLLIKSELTVTMHILLIPYTPHNFESKKKIW